MSDEIVTCSHCGRGYAFLSTPEEQAVVDAALKYVSAMAQTGDSLDDGWQATQDWRLQQLGDAVDILTETRKLPSRLSHSQK